MSKIYKNRVRYNPIDILVVNNDLSQKTYHCYAVTQENGYLCLTYLHRNERFSHRFLRFSKIKGFYLISYFNKVLPLEYPYE